MTLLIIVAALTGGIALTAGAVVLGRWSARFTVVQWDGPADHPRNAPRKAGGAK